MSDYTKNYDWTAKDSLASGDPDKIIKGAEFDDEFDAIVVAVATKFDAADRGAANGIASLDASTLVPAAQLPAATELAQGAVELATTAEVVTGTDTTRAVTAAGVEAWAAQNGGIVKDLSDLADPNADRIIFWDDSVGAAAFLTVGTNLSISGTTISAPTATLESAINHDNLTGFVANEHINHTSVTLTAGVGLAGGGNIAANRTFSLDISTSELTAIAISGINTSNDGILIDDAGTPKRMAWSDMGVVVVDLDGNQTFALGDANTLQRMTGAGPHTWTIPTNASVAFNVGTVILCHNDATADDLTLDPDTGVTLNSFIEESGTTSRIVLPGGTAALIKTDTNTWALTGDIA